MSAFNTHEIADLFFGAAKSETAYGTDIFGGSAPSSGEWCAFRNLEITPLIEHRENPRGTATVSGEPSIPIKVRNDVVWEVPLLGKAGSDLGPIHEALLMMCGLQRTIDAGVDVAYTPYSYNDMAECPSATFAQYLLNEEGDVKKMLARGCRSNFEMVIEMGQAGYIGGTGQALYDDEPTAWSSPPTLPQQYSADKTPMVATSLSLQTEGTTTYPIERLTLAAMSLGIARRSIEIMNNYAKERIAFGKSLNHFGQIQRHIAESYAEYMAGRAYVYNTAANLALDSAGNRVDSDGVKLYCAMMAKNVADRAIQVLGGYGYVAEYHVERLWRDAKLLEIGGGTNEAHQKNMTRDLVGREKIL